MKRYLILMLALVAGCSTPTYEHLGPKFEIDKLLQGELHAYGIVRDRSGNLLRRFKVNMTGRWNDQGTGTLDEQFLYDDGERSERLWTFTPSGDGGYIGSANDTLSEAVVRVDGPVLTLKYRIALEVGEANYEVVFDDALYAIDDKRIVNVSDIRKFGFKVGEVVLVIQPGHLDLSTF